jgi:basic membrane protein A
MKKILALTLIALLAFGLMAGCGTTDDPTPAPGPTETETVPYNGIEEIVPTDLYADLRLAFIHVGGIEDQGYTFRQHQGTLDMMAAFGITDDQVRNYFNTVPGAAVDEAILDAIDWGAQMIFGTSFGFGGNMLEKASEYPDVQFFHATGNLAVDAALPNFHNYFGNMSQARYLSGIAAGLKTESNKLGFVAAHPNAEVITGFTAFYLGALSVNPDVTMEVMFMNEWNNPTREAQIAQALIDRGADVVGQHADSPSTQTVAQDNEVWSVGYNNNMIPIAPQAVLVSPMFDWSVYLKFAVERFVTGLDIQTDFLAGMNEGMIFLSELNHDIVAEGTADAIAEAEAKIRTGWNIFTGPLSDNDGNELLADGEEHVEPLSAPSWTHIIEGITVIE